MMMATRGSAFWELYYSYNMMNEGQKWVINADVLHWINDNYETLKHAKLIGQTPAKELLTAIRHGRDRKGLFLSATRPMK